jgi:hypothetical protein
MILRGLLRPAPPPEGSYDEVLLKLARQLKRVPRTFGRRGARNAV